MTTAGRMRGSVTDSFFPSRISPRIGVISDPEYVVGTQTCFKPFFQATAFPSPMALPPPTLMTTSRPLAASTAPSMIWEGLWTTAVEWIAEEIDERAKRD
jgi:hypothetical protein